MLVINEQKINFACMSDKGISFFWLIAYTMLSVFPLESFSQEGENGQKKIKLESSDTIDYIPAWYFGALDFNLMIAASKGLSSEIDRLVGLGASVNTYNEDGATPLIFAISYNQPDAVNTLLKYSPHLDDITTNSETALMIAVKNNYPDIAEALIRAGAEIDFTDYHGTTPLHYASLYGYLEMVDILLYYDAQVDAKTDEGITPLHAATWAGNIDVADLLIQNGANMEARDNEGYTPFLIASSFGDTTMMDMLSKFGVDIYTRNVYSHNALTLAIAFGHKDAVTYLVKKSDRWKEAGNMGHDPYKIAAKYRRKDIAAILRNNNIPGKIRLGFDQAALAGTARFTPHDFYSGLSASFKEPYLNAGFILGCDMKLWYTKVLIKDSEKYYYQYYDKGAMFYAGLFKDFDITKRADKGNLLFITSLYGGYTFGNKFKGTQVTPDKSLKLIPSLSLKWTKNALSVFSGVEYIRSEYYKVGPVWFRIGVSYNYYFDNLRIRLKKIKWN
jgi:ankyrin repeat protein